MKQPTKPEEATNTMARQRVNMREAVSMIRLRLDFTASALTGYTNYEGDYVIKSYRTEIARATKGGIVWISNEFYSMTTSRHLSTVKQGFSKDDVVSASSLEHAKTTTKWADLEAVLA